MRRLSTFIIVLGLLPGNAYASWENWSWLTQYQQPNIHWRQLALHPNYALSQTYDSNIYLAPPDQPGGVSVGGGVQDSLITQNNLGLETDLPWHKLHDLSLGYGFESQVYTNRPGINNTINQQAHGDYTYAGAYGLTFKAGDDYINTTDQAFSELVARDRRWANTIYTSLDYDPKHGRLAGGIDVSQRNDKYIDPALAQLLNRYADKVGFNIGYMVQAKTKAYLSYHHDIIHYSVPANLVLGESDKNSRSHDVKAGVTGQLAPKLEGRIEGGMTYRQYDVTYTSGTSRIFIVPTAVVAVTFEPDTFTTIILGFSRFFQESTDTSNPFYYSNDLSLDVKHKFPHKFSAGFSAAMGIDQYKNPEVIDSTIGATARRRDDIYQGGVWVAYDIKEWLSTGLAYVYRERNSTLSGQFNYQDQRTTWNAALKF